MIAIQNSPVDEVTRLKRDEVLDRLRTVHRIAYFEDPADLARFLERGLGELELAGFAPGLRRIVLVVDDLRNRAVIEVATRLLPGAALLVFDQAHAWHALFARLDDLTALAQRVEPGYQPGQQG